MRRGTCDGAEGAVAHRMGEQRGHVPRRRVMVGVMQAGRVREMRAGHAERGGGPVHQLDERLDVAGHIPCQRDGAIRPGRQHQPVQHILHRGALPRLQAGHRGVLLPQLREHVGRGLDHVVQRLGVVEDHHRGHHLGQRGGIHACVGVARCDGLAAVGVDEHRVPAVQPIERYGRAERRAAGRIQQRRQADDGGGHHHRDRRPPRMRPSTRDRRHRRRIGSPCGTGRRRAEYRVVISGCAHLKPLSSRWLIRTSR